MRNTIADFIHVLGVFALSLLLMLVPWFLIIVVTVYALRLMEVID